MAFYGQGSFADTFSSIILKETPNKCERIKKVEECAGQPNVAVSTIQFIHRNKASFQTYPGKISATVAKTSGTATIIGQMSDSQHTTSIESSSEEEACADCHKKERRVTKLRRQVVQLQGEVVGLRHKEAVHVKTKISQQISQRSVNIVDNAIFTNSFLQPDAVSAEMTVDIIDPSTLSSVTNCVDQCRLIQMRKFSLKGDFVQGKAYRCNTKAEELRLACHELRCLKYIGDHSNIVQSLGLY